MERRPNALFSSDCVDRMVWLWSQKQPFTYRQNRLHHWFYHSKSIQEAIFFLLSAETSLKKILKAAHQVALCRFHGLLNGVINLMLCIYIPWGCRRCFNIFSKFNILSELFHPNEYIKYIELLCQFYTYLHANQTVILLHNLCAKGYNVELYIEISTTFHRMRMEKKTLRL